MESFTDLYAILWYKFDVAWKKENPQDIMAFGNVHDTFFEEIRQFFSQYETSISSPLDLSKMQNK
jgi:hypothetical protein